MADSIEDFEKQVCAVLGQLLPAQLQATAARYLQQDRDEGLTDDDGNSLVKLEVPAKFYPGGTNIVTAWPSIEVAVPEDELFDFDVAQTDADATVTLVIQAWVKHAVWEVLNPLHKRYAAAIFETLRPTDALPGAAIERVRRAYGANPELRGEDDDRIQAGALLVYTLTGSWKLL